LIFEAVEIRLATEDDFQFLPAVEDAAGEVYADIGYDDIAAMPPMSAEEYVSFSAQGGAVWLAELQDSTIAGYCALTPLGTNIHIHELSVRKRYAKQGIGSQLLKFVLKASEKNGYDSVTLLTFEKVVFNAPFYTRFGFEIISDLTGFPHLKKLADAERQTPLFRYGRVAMIKNLP